MDPEIKGDAAKRGEHHRCCLRQAQKPLRRFGLLLGSFSFGFGAFGFGLGAIGLGVGAFSFGLGAGQLGLSQPLALLRAFAFLPLAVFD